MKQYDVIQLKDGRKGAVVEIINDFYIVDVGDSPKNWETITVRKKDIEKTLIEF